MLIELKVQDFAIIDNIQMSLTGGLNILSGETGAGKSILLKSLALIMGGKASSEMIRTGAKFATIEGCFDLSKRSDILSRLEELEIPVEESSLVVRRIVSPLGKSKVFLNSVMCNVNILREIIAPLVEIAGVQEPLIEMTGQHDNKNLLNRAYHLELLDSYLGLQTLRAEYRALFRERTEVLEVIETASLDVKMRAQRMDYLKFQIEAIELISPIDGEDAELQTRLNRLKNTTRLLHFCDLGIDRLYSSDDSILSQVQTLQNDAQELSQIDEALGKIARLVEPIASQLEDVVYELRTYSSGLEADPESLEKAELRFSEIRKLQKKFGPSILDINKNLFEMQSELNDLKESDTRLASAQERLLVLEKDLKNRADDLHSKRFKGATLLSESVNHELQDLNMKGTTFEAHVEKTDELTLNGVSHIEFFTRASRNDEPKPLTKVASGGELSRILLSLKRVIGSSERPRTFLFDEVDAGVSGPTAEKVGKKLRTIARGQQVICVTHLPQVAAFADSHFLISKKMHKNSSVSMQVKEIETESRIEELARLISGERITDTSLAHARQLLKEATL